jgi:ankyrin repeat protein
MHKQQKQTIFLNNGLREGDEAIRLQFEQAIKTNNIKTVEKLLKQKPELSTLSNISTHETTFYFAIKALANYRKTHAYPTSPIPLLDTLLQYGAKINQKNINGNTPLHEAINAGDLPLVVYLISHGADLSAPNNTLQTPLHCAAMQKNPAFMAALASALSSIKTYSFQDTSGDTPYELANRTKNTAVVAFLEAHLANTDILPTVENPTQKEITLFKEKNKQFLALGKFLLSNELFRLSKADPTAFQTGLRKTLKNATTKELKDQKLALKQLLVNIERNPRIDPNIHIQLWLAQSPDWLQIFPKLAAASREKNPNISLESLWILLVDFESDSHEFRALASNDLEENLIQLFRKYLGNELFDACFRSHAKWENTLNDNKLNFIFNLDSVCDSYAGVSIRINDIFDKLLVPDLRVLEAEKAKLTISAIDSISYSLYPPKYKVAIKLGYLLTALDEEFFKKYFQKIFHKDFILTAEFKVACIAAYQHFKASNDFLAEQKKIPAEKPVNAKGEKEKEKEKEKNASTNFFTTYREKSEDIAEAVLIERKKAKQFDLQNEHRLQIWEFRFEQLAHACEEAETKYEKATSKERPIKEDIIKIRTSETMTMREKYLVLAGIIIAKVVQKNKQHKSQLHQQMGDSVALGSESREEKFFKPVINLFIPTPIQSQCEQAYNSYIDGTLHVDKEENASISKAQQTNQSTLNINTAEVPVKLPDDELTVDGKVFFAGDYIKTEWNSKSFLDRRNELQAIFASKRIFGVETLAADYLPIHALKLLRDKIIKSYEKKPHTQNSEGSETNSQKTLYSVLFYELLRKLPHEDTVLNSKGKAITVEEAYGANHILLLDPTVGKLVRYFEINETPWEDRVLALLGYINLNSARESTQEKPKSTWKPSFLSSDKSTPEPKPNHSSFDAYCYYREQYKKLGRGLDVGEFEAKCRGTYAQYLEILTPKTESTFSWFGKGK